MTRLHCRAGANARRLLRGRVYRAGVVASIVLAGAAGGCSKPLLSPNEPRSQYSRYDLVRGRFAPQYVEDEFGRKMPNLRGRLLLSD